MVVKSSDNLSIIDRWTNDLFHPAPCWKTVLATTQRIYKPILLRQPMLSEGKDRYDTGKARKYHRRNPTNLAESCRPVPHQTILPTRLWLHLPRQSIPPTNFWRLGTLCISALPNSVWRGLTLMKCTDDGKSWQRAVVKHTCIKLLDLSWLRSNTMHMFVPF